jgi:hypothetical protein
MFSRLDPYFTATIRHAESADARLEIRRDEQREQEGRKYPKEKKDDPSAAWDDSTVVSVRALQAFLESLIADQARKPATAPATPPAAPLPASTGQAAQAARAYRTTANVAEPPAPPPAAPGDKPLLTAEELRTIHRLIGDLKLLADRKVEHLNILRSDSFLQSLVDAAARARNAL